MGGGAGHVRPRPGPDHRPQATGKPRPPRAPRGGWRCRVPTPTAADPVPSRPSPGRRALSPGPRAPPSRRAAGKARSTSSSRRDKSLMAAAVGRPRQLAALCEWRTPPSGHRPPLRVAPRPAASPAPVARRRGRGSAGEEDGVSRDLNPRTPSSGPDCTCARFPPSRAWADLSRGKDRVCQDSSARAQCVPIRSFMRMCAGLGL